MHRKIDLPLLLITSGLIIFGLLMVYSASNVVALYKYDDSYYFIKRQFIFAAIGIVKLKNRNNEEIYVREEHDYVNSNGKNNSRINKGNYYGNKK